MMKLSLAVSCFVFVSISIGFAQEQPSNIDPLEHPNGLSYIVFKRCGFNKNLGMLSRAFARKANLDESQISLAMSLMQERSTKQNEALAELQPEWKDASKEQRSGLISKLVRRDDELVEEQLSKFEEVFSPSQQLAVVRNYLRSGSPMLLFDPVVSRWVGLSARELTEMEKHYEVAHKFLRDGRANSPNTFGPLPGDMDKKYRLLREKMWSALPEEKIVNCFRAYGFIGQDEGLEEYIRQFPERSEYASQVVPAFKEAKSRVESSK